MILLQNAKGQLGRISRVEGNEAHSFSLASFGFGATAIRVPTILLVLGVRHSVQ